MHDCEKVRAYYDAQAAREWTRAERHPVEFGITRRLLLRHLPPPPARVLDVGGGPGHYSLWLSGLGYRVTLVDLSPGNIALAREKSAELGVALDGCLVGNALELDRHAGPGWDAVLLMGPLYHLTRPEDRQAALSQAVAALAPGGILATAFISDYAPIIDSLKYDPGEIRGKGAELMELFRHGINQGGDGDGFTAAWFCGTAGIEALMNRPDLERLALCTQESILGPYEEALKKAEPGLMEECLELAMAFVEDEGCRACGEHYLHLARKR